MRIIAGKFRHRKLLTNPGQTTRPIIDRAKVRLFDLIRHELPDARVADIFAGTGTFGFEALSRGAKSAVFCEADHRAHELLRKNAEVLKTSDDVICWRVDVLRCSFRPKGAGEWAPYRVVFFDPPYKMADDLKPGTPLFRCLERLARTDTTTDGALLVVRVPIHCQPEFPPAWSTEMVFEVASMAIHLLRKTGGTAHDLGSTAEDDSPADADGD